MSTSTQFKPTPVIINHDAPVVPAMPVFGIVKEPDAPLKTTFRTAAATKGKVDNSANKQWANRPDEDKYLDLYSMRQAVAKRTMDSRQFAITPDSVTCDAYTDADNQEGIIINVGDKKTILNNWTFNQVCNELQMPASYIKRLPSDIAAINIQNALRSNGELKALVTGSELRSVTSPTYGRIWDYQVLDEVIKIAGNGVNETEWKVPGCIDWSSSNGVTVEYNPFVDVTKETTTLYASDRDMYLFLVDDTHPIEIGTLSNGEPDLLFRGFIVWNSEVGGTTFGIQTMLMRGVCANRNIWGVEGSKSLIMRHGKVTADRFAKKAYPMLASYATAGMQGIIDKVNGAKSLIVASNNEERIEFLTDKVKVPLFVAEKVLQSVRDEEQHEAHSMWDMVQGLTAYARKIPYQNERIDLEHKAGALMDLVA